MFTEQLPDLLDYVNNIPGFACLVGDMNIHFDNPLQSLAKQTLIIIIMVIFKCYFSCEHIALSINKNNNGVNIALGKTNKLKALCMMQINT